MSKPKRFLHTVVVSTAALLGMGIAMPSCPGQQAMQQQIDSLQAKNTEQAQQAQALDGQLKAMNADMLQVKTLLEQVSNTVLAQKQALEQIDATLKTTQQQVVDVDAALKAGAKPVKKRK